MRENGLIETLMTPVRKVVRRLSAQPQLWNLFRRILEFNFRAEKRVIREELIPRARRVEKAESRKPRLLDMGCGTGELAGSFIKAGYEYYGVDIEPERIRYARKTFPGGKFHVMDASNLTYKSFRPLLERAGPPRIRFHDLTHLRHAHAVQRHPPQDSPRDDRARHDTADDGPYSHVLSDM